MNNRRKQSPGNPSIRQDLVPVAPTARCPSSRTNWNSPGGLDSACVWRSHVADSQSLVLAYLAQNPVLCPSCGYSLQGVPSAKCPECGRELILRIVTPTHESQSWLIGAGMVILVLIGIQHAMMSFALFVAGSPACLVSGGVTLWSIAGLLRIAVIAALRQPLRAKIVGTAMVTAAVSLLVNIVVLLGSLM
jgi:predicted RNA-binding Zn-ribbon protein involved in translation (DUF1610 family)